MSVTKMRLLLITGILLSVSSCFSQKTDTAWADTCRIRKRINSCAGIDFDSAKIDTITAKTFDLMLTQVNQKLLSHSTLTLIEDRSLVMIMNTSDWSGFFKQAFIPKRFPLLNSIDKIFTSKYERVLRCKYSVCHGAGFSPYYKELHTQYLGNPFACDRFYIRD